MTSLRTQAPPVNLKERIAALQQKNAASNSSTQPQRPLNSPPLTSPNSTSGSVPQSNVAALREKIAKFEKKGGVPVPRGSFGLGAPPDRGQAKKSGELYGNRIPVPVKPQTTGNGSSGYIRPQYTGGPYIQQQSTGPVDGGDSNSRSPSPFFDEKGPGPTRDYQATRSFSSSSSPPSPPEELKPIHTGRRGTEFVKAMEMARKAEADGVVYDPRLREREGSTSPTPPAMPPPIIANRRFSAFMDDRPPTIIVSPQLELEEEQFEGYTSDLVTSSEPETFASTAEEEKGSAPRYVDNDSPSSASVSAPPPHDRSNESLLPVSSNSVLGGPLVPEPEAEEDSALSSSSREFEASLQMATETDESVSLSAFAEKSELSTPSLQVSESQTVPQPSVSKVDNRPSVSITSSAVSVPVQNPLLTSYSSTLSSGLVGPEEILPSSAVAVAVDDLPTVAEPLARTKTETEMKVEGEVSEAPNLQAKNIDALDGDEDGSDDQEDNIDRPGSPLFTRPKPLPTTPIADDFTPSTFPPTPASGLSSFPPTPAAASARESFLSSPQTVDIPSRRSSFTESSPGHLTLAHRISPVTSRGVSIFLPGTSAPADTEVADASVDDGADTAGPGQERPKTAVPSALSDTISPEGVGYGVVTIGHRPVPTMAHPRSFSSSHTEIDFNPTFDPNEGHHTFNTVVHGRTHENTVYASGSRSATLPRAKAVGTPQRHRPTVLEEPMSPGLFGDLALLVEQSAILEKRLLDGELPDEAKREKMDTWKGLVSAPMQSGTNDWSTMEQEQGNKHKDLLRRRPSTKSLVSGDGRDSSDSKRSRKPSFSLRNPLSRSKSTIRKDPREDSGEGGRSKSLYLTTTHSSQPTLSAIPPVPAMPQTVVVVSPSTSASNYSDDIPPTPPPKSPSAKYLSSFRRFGSTRSSHAPSGRHSVSISSEISSEDSVAVLTPPDNSPGFLGSAPLPEARSRTSTSQSVLGVGRPGSVINVPWPSVSPKKTQGIGRAASFAEKMFRGRKKSTASTISSTDVADLLPEIPNVFPPSPSLHELVMLEEAPLDTTFDSLHPPPSTPPHHNTSGGLTPSTRNSWMSTISTDSSLRSPLFDKDVFDAFPTVPQTVPSPLTRAAIAGHAKESSQSSISHFQVSAGSDGASVRYGKNNASVLRRAASASSTSTLGPNNMPTDLL